jgi:hypothetical protein
MSNSRPRSPSQIIFSCRSHRPGTRADPNVLERNSARDAGSRPFALRNARAAAEVRRISSKAYKAMRVVVGLRGIERHASQDAPTTMATSAKSSQARRLVRLLPRP